MKKILLPLQELRTTKITVRLSEIEHLKLLKIMNDCGHESLSTFLRLSGLRSKIPPRITAAPITVETASEVRSVLARVNELITLGYGEWEELHTDLHRLNRSINRHRLEVITEFTEKYAEAMALRKRADT